jgi:hypothetical protein
MDYSCAVRVNGSLTDNFHPNIGVKQGCLLSPGLFAIYMDSLIADIRATGIGARVGDETIGALLYADDLVIMADSEAHLQQLLDVLGEWCKTWRMSLSDTKSKIVVFRNKTAPEHTTVFKCGNLKLEYAASYKYLGLELQYDLNWDKTVKILASSGSRALGL